MATAPSSWFDQFNSGGITNPQTQGAGQVVNGVPLSPEPKQYTQEWWNSLSPQEQAARQSMRTDQGGWGGGSGPLTNITYGGGAIPTSAQPGQTPFANLQDPSAWMNLVNNPDNLKAWIQQHNPGWSPDLVNYYAGVIQKQPGANPTEQAGSAQYYLDKFHQDPFYGGQGGQGGGQASGAAFQTDDPSYQWRLQQGLDAVQKSAAARGGLLTGGTLKALTQYGQGLASTEYGNAFNRQFDLAQLGLNATGLATNAGQSYANNASNAIYGAGNANSAGSVAQGNIWGNAFSNLGNLGTQAYLQNRSGGSAYPNGTYADGSPLIYGPGY